MKFLRLFIFCFLTTAITFAEIQLQRYSISTYTNSNTVIEDIGQLGANNVDEIQNLTALRVLFRQYANPNTSSNKISLDNRLTMVDSLNSEIYQDPLIYPNPVKLTSEAVLGYWLSRPDNIQIQIYDMFGHRIFNEIKVQGMLGARMGYNRIKINAQTFDYYNVSAGVYFLFIYDSAQKIIGKTKFAIIP